MLETNDLLLSETEVPVSDIQRVRYNDVEIPIVSSIKVTEDMWGRIDIFIMRQYSRLVLLPLILDFNGYEDITDIKVGAVLDLPNLSYMNGVVEIIQDINNGEFEVPGIALHGYDNLTKEEHAATVQSNISQTASADVTTANPKLQVTVRKVKADLEKGTITF